MTELELLNNVKNGKKQLAFSYLMQTYRERLYWHIRKMVISHDDADDVLQNTFMKVWRSVDNFRGGSSIYTWLYRIATNETLTFLNKKRAQYIDSIDDIELNMINQLKADSYFSGDEIEEKLQRAIVELPEKQRLVFNMKYFDSMKYDEMAEVLNTSVGALKASYHHAVKKIEAYLTTIE